MAQPKAAEAAPDPRPGPRTYGDQVAVPCRFMRGGTSRGPFFRAADLPTDPAARDAVLLAAMGSPDPRQIDGLGGANPLTSKAGIVGPGDRRDIDLVFRFAQLQPDSDLVDTTANCGNMLAAVVPFAVESGLLVPDGDTTTARVLTLNTGLVAEITVRTPLSGAPGGTGADEEAAGGADEEPAGGAADGSAGGTGARYVAYDGDTAIDGVPGTAAPVTIGFLDTAGSVCSALLPTGNVRDRVEAPGIGPVDVTCIDNGQPLVIVDAADLGRTGHESVGALNADTELKERLEALRLVCGELMGLGDVTSKNYPKMTLVSPPAHGGAINTRSFIPHVCHESIGVLAAVTAATACALDGTVAAALAAVPPGTDVNVSVEHPAGEFTVALGLSPDEPRRVTRSALVRTARLIMAGDVLIPGGAWNPRLR
ncbi:PrpF domain-containing protein [Streptomyces corynorhini]|uniref:4-oxalomesaconate tautomerase n=1 Tax=Streptomyces corynorhini TaxID=2282652 RepID=A0A370B6I7_9ACTN|nr:PrpF domain-containing protein [Streptomyces corynorhini]RDG37428.1 4-oxalomesaconate tautomerase [Streptomyces corynorhini]